MVLVSYLIVRALSGLIFCEVVVGVAIFFLNPKRSFSEAGVLVTDSGTTWKDDQMTMKLKGRLEFLTVNQTFISKLIHV